jgi:predicted RNase H-like HicB family nuclease
MYFTVHVHKAEEGGFWAEVEEIPGCVTQGDTVEELDANLQEVIELCLEGLIEDYVKSLSERVEIERGETIWNMSLKFQREKSAAKA